MNFDAVMKIFFTVARMKWKIKLDSADDVTQNDQTRLKILESMKSLSDFGLFCWLATLPLTAPKLRLFPIPLNSAFTSHLAWLGLYFCTYFFQTPMPRRRESNPHQSSRVKSHRDHWRMLNRLSYRAAACPQKVLLLKQLSLAPTKL